MSKYRIKVVTDGLGEDYFYLQKKILFFFWVSIDRCYSEQSAREDIDWYVRQELKSKYKTKEIINV